MSFACRPKNCWESSCIWYRSGAFFWILPSWGSGSIHFRMPRAARLTRSSSNLLRCMLPSILVSWWLLQSSPRLPGMKIRISLDPCAPLQKKWSKYQCNSLVKHLQTLNLFKREKTKQQNEKAIESIGESTNKNIWMNRLANFQNNTALTIRKQKQQFQKGFNPNYGKERKR